MALFLTCGDLTSSGCAVGDYLIEWRLNSNSGNTVFRTSNSGNTDPNIDAFHPVVDEIVVAGDLYPVVKYAVLDGERYVCEDNGTDRYSADLNSCIPPFTIDPINCSTSNFSPTNDLPYDIFISRSVGQGSKDREFTFSLSSSTQYFAWCFVAYSISDGIQVFYCTQNDPTGTLLDFIVVGKDAKQDLAPANYPVDPIGIKPFSNQEKVKYVTDLTGINYTTGDYLKIKIIGNYNDPSQDGTNWDIYMRCLDSLDPLPDYSRTFTKTGDVKFSQYITSSCRYEFKYPVQESFSSVTYTQSDFQKYFYIKRVGGGIRNSSTETNVNFSDTSWNETLYVSTVSNQSCNLYAGEVNIEKTGTSLTLSFTESADYLLFKNQYDNRVASTNYTTASNADPVVDPEYYAFFTFGVYDNNVGCIDGATGFKVIYVHWSSVWIFDDSLDKIIISLNVPANQLQDYGDCNNWNELVTGYLQSMNGTKTELDYNYTFIKFPSSSGNFESNFFFSPMSKRFPSSFDSNQFTIYIPKVMVNNIYTPTNAEGFLLNFVNDYFYTYPGYDRLTFTDPSTDQTRLRSWVYKRARFFTTKVESDIFIFDEVGRATP